MDKGESRGPALKRGIMSRILPFMRPYQRKLVWLTFLTAFLTVLTMLPPLFTRAIINDVIGDGRENLLFGLAIFIFGVPLLHAFISYFHMLGVAFVSQRFVLDIRMAVYRHLLSLHIGFFSKNSTGKLLNRLMGDSSAIQQLLNVGTLQIATDLISSLFAIVAMLYINWRLTLPIVILVVLFVINFNFMVHKLRWTFRAARFAEDRLASGVQNRLVANMTMKTFGAEEREGAVFEEHSTMATEQARRSWTSHTEFEYNIQLFQEIGWMVIFFLGCAMVLMGTASYGDVTAVTAYAMQIIWPAVRVSQLAGQIQGVRISTERLFEILDDMPQISSKPDAVPLPFVRGKVDFNTVEFAYEPERPVLCGIDFHVAPGETVALVGTTGCGKTTILSLLMRLFDVQKGSVCIDDHDLRDVSLSTLRNQFGIVLQESLLFTVSIADNIRYARPNATQADIEQAAQIAEIHNDILKLPRGYQSIIGDRDVQLSVGQKQRLSIARAVLSRPAILIMDEATSSLDSESERAIQVAMERFLVGRTSFIVAHRLSTIRNADRIILLDKGKIIEMGHHEELMAIPDGRYKDLYEKHSGKGVITDDTH